MTPEPVTPEPAPATVRLWQAGGRDVVPADELRTTLDHDPGLMLVATGPRASTCW